MWTTDGPGGDDVDDWGRENTSWRRTTEDLTASRETAARSARAGRHVMGEPVTAGHRGAGQSGAAGEFASGTSTDGVPVPSAGTDHTSLTPSPRWSP